MLGLDPIANGQGLGWRAQMGADGVRVVRSSTGRYLIRLFCKRGGCYLDGIGY
jgi:hypothetical protein